MYAYLDQMAMKKLILVRNFMCQKPKMQLAIQILYALFACKTGMHFGKVNSMSTNYASKHLRA